MDVRHVLPNIQTSTLVLHRSGDLIVDVGQGRAIANSIPGARFVELTGENHIPFLGDYGAIVDEVEEFLTGVRPLPERDRVLATVLFTDIVGSTELAMTWGDRQWRSFLDDHDRLVEEQIARFQGRTIKSTGDGVLALFDGPGRAVMCACALRASVRELGAEIRSGLHCGEVELRGDDVGGIAVHIAARIAGIADAGQILVSSTVKDLITGSGIAFDDVGTCELKGLQESWRLFSVKS
jgi:class 3 adenylate cyclase